MVVYPYLSDVSNSQQGISIALVAFNPGLEMPCLCIKF